MENSYLKYCRVCGDLCDGPYDLCFDCKITKPIASEKWVFGVLVAGIILSAIITWWLDEYPNVETISIIDGQVEVVER